jgi:hypothetical protein
LFLATCNISNFIHITHFSTLNGKLLVLRRCRGNAWVWPPIKTQHRRKQFLQKCKYKSIFCLTWLIYWHLIEGFNKSVVLLGIWNFTYTCTQVTQQTVRSQNEKSPCCMQTGRLVSRLQRYHPVCT